MATQPLVQRSSVHLQDVIDNQATKLDSALLERVRREAIPSMSQDERKSLVGLVVQLLQSIQQDPTPATKLAEELVQTYTFSEFLDTHPSVDLIAGLKSPSPAVQLLVLKLLSLAPRHIGDVGIVAGNPELVSTLINGWLRATDIGVAEAARQVIRDLLLSESFQQPTTDSDSISQSGSGMLQQGLMQRRIFKDKNVYDLFFTLPSLKTVGQSDQPPKRDKTLAQGRLLDLLKEIYLLPDVWHSQISDVESAHGLNQGEGLLHYAALYMIDKSDVLLRVTQIDFLTDLVGSIATKDLGYATGAKLFEFLTTTGVHSEIISIYTSPESQDPLDITFHYAPAARYVAAFAQTFYEQFLSDTAIRTRVFKRLHEVLDAVPSSQWARNDGPAHDLHVLVSLPRLALIPDPILVLRLPTRPPSADAFRTLAHLFSGRLASDRNTETLTFPPPVAGNSSSSHAPPAAPPASPAWQQAEQWAARYLFLAYLDKHPSFWTNVIDASSVTAFRDTAVAAIDLIHAIVAAHWRTDPGATAFGMDLSGTQTLAGSGLGSVSDHDHGWYGSQPPANGIAAVIHPQVIDILLPFIMKGPEGRGVALLGADTESSAYHIHKAKLQLTAALETGIREAAGRLSDDQEEKAMLTELAAGLSGLRRQGFGRGTEPGAEVGTMEL